MIMCVIYIILGLLYAPFSLLFVSFVESRKNSPIHVMKKGFWSLGNNFSGSISDLSSILF